MPFSHHSHSGQFCGHAKDTLEEVVQDAITKKLHTFCTTEHIPRHSVDFYPEEVGVHTEASLVKLFDDYYVETCRLREKYSDRIRLFVGFEGEWIRATSLDIINGLLTKYRFDLFIGSVHHMHTLPIDYDAEMYQQARDISGGTDEALYADYFDDQLRMLQALKPPIVGHLDLIRLKSDDPERSFKTWPQVWEKIIRNLTYIASYGGVLELNSASLRKGMSEPYPKVEICKEFLALEGIFTLSDDSHGTEQVALNYSKTVAKAKDAGIQYLYHAVPVESAHADAKPFAGSMFSHMRWQANYIDDIAQALSDRLP